MAEEYENVEDYVNAYRFYEEAYNRLPLPKYKQLSKSRIMRIRDRWEHEGILYVVMCTKNKIWDKKSSTAKYIPAREAYTGESFKKWLRKQESKTYPWLILSARYGFIEPDHPIPCYDVSFTLPGTGPISDETLRNQVLYQTRFGIPLKNFREIRVVGNEIYFKKVKGAFSKTCAKVIQFKTNKKCEFKDVIKEFEETGLKRLLMEFVNSKIVSVEKLNKQRIPEVKGIYVFYTEQTNKPLYLGITKNLRRRIWDDHLNGDRIASTLRKKLFKTLGNEEKVSQFLRKCWIKIKPLPDIDNRLLKRLEHLAIAYLNPKLND